VLKVKIKGAKLLLSFNSHVGKVCGSVPESIGGYTRVDDTWPVQSQVREYLNDTT